MPEPFKPFASVFLSYSSADEDFAKWLDAHLRAYGIAVWFAPNNMRGGQRISDQVERAIGSQDKIILILSESSLASNWVATEVSTAVAREIEYGYQILYPIRITDYESIRGWKLFDSDRGLDTAKYVRQYFIPDFTNWQSSIGVPESLHRLVEDLRPSN